MPLLGKMLNLAKPEASEPRQQSIFTIAKDPTAAAMKMNYRESKTAVEKMIADVRQPFSIPTSPYLLPVPPLLTQTSLNRHHPPQAIQKLLLSMVPQPPTTTDPDREPPPPNLPDDATQALVKTAFQNLRRVVVEMLEDFAEADMTHHKKELKQKGASSNVAKRALHLLASGQWPHFLRAHGMLSHTAYSQPTPFLLTRVLTHGLFSAIDLHKTLVGSMGSGGEVGENAQGGEIGVAEQDRRAPKERRARVQPKARRDECRWRHSASRCASAGRGALQ